MGRFSVCPYYKSDKRMSVSCEDTVRQFYSKEHKRAWTKAFCDNAWEECRYARDLNDLYERMDGMTNQKDRKIAALEHLAEARKKENEQLRQQLGYINARNKSLEMMLGYLCDKYGVEQVNLNAMSDFYGMYTVNWKKTDNEHIAIEKVKK